MPDEVFSASRLRKYRVLEGARLGDAVELQVLDAAVSSRLWLPFSLIEIAFRNSADRAITAAHPSGADWFMATPSGTAPLQAMKVTSPANFRRRRDDGSEDDPIAEAARFAGRQLGRDEISRDDVVAHLMLGFWVNRCPDALAADPGIRLWDLLAARFDAPLNDSDHLTKVMTHLLRTRNRVAHHEPLLFRNKHVFDKTGEPKVGPALVTSLQDAIPPLLKDVELIVQTANTMAPMATKFIAAVPDLVRRDISVLEATLATERDRYREARDARIAAQRSERAARRG